jgi:starch synthase
MSTQKLKILVISAEVAPFAKVGGLADVAGALPKALKAQGHDVRVVMPCYKMIETNPAYAVEDALDLFPVPVRPDTVEMAFVKQTRIPVAEMDDEVPVYLIGNIRTEAERQARPDFPGYFQLATESKKVYTLEPDPYVFFCRAVLEMLTQFKPAWKPDILHCNDWQSGLVPVYLRIEYADHPHLKQAASVFTIHNLAYQGNFDRAQWSVNGLPESLFSVDGLEFYGQWTFMKGGLQFADRVNTVSPNYACEIQTPDYGCGLQGLLSTLAEEGRLTGIINGIDYEEYNPATDPRLAHNFSQEEPAGKAECKAALQRECGFPQNPDALVIGLISRLADQKGLDLIAQVAEEMLALPVQFVLLGTGDTFYEKYFAQLQERHPYQARAFLRFDIDLAQRIYAGSDLFLMPSRFEPCGLGQMFALRYGTIPIVRATGGLKDSVHDFDPDLLPEGNGFVFSQYTPEELLQTIIRAVNTLRNPEHRRTLLLRALGCDFSWERSAIQYVSLFRQAVSDRQRALRQQAAS